MMEKATAGIELLYYSLPIISGSSLAFIGLQRKFFTTRRYVFGLWQAWVYVTLSALGSLVMTIALHHIGTEIISHSLINAVLLSLLGSGSFLGIASNFRISGITESDNDENFQTIRDFIYDFLEISIEQKIRQLVQSKLKKFHPNSKYNNGRYFPSEEDERFLREVRSLMAGGSIPNNELQKCIAYFDECVEKGDYVSVIRELLKHYDLDYLLSELSAFMSVEGESESKPESSEIRQRRIFPFKLFPFLQQWAIVFFLWLGFGLSMPGIFQQLTPFLISLLTKYFAINSVFPLGIVSIFFAVCVSLLSQVRK